MNQTTKEVNPLGTERIGKLVVNFAVPSIISIVVNSLYNMVDQVFIGQGVGYLGNAATNVVMPLATILMALAMMMGDGAAAYMSLRLGQGKTDEASKGAGQAVTMAIAIGFVMMLLFHIFLEPLCRFFGATENVLPYALDYGKIIICGFPFSAICCAFGSIIRADGRPRTSMAGLLIGCITNLILDPIYIFVFHWGVRGAAVATITGQFLNAVFYIICLFRCKTIRFHKDYFDPELALVKTVASLGVSSFITQIASTAVMAVMNNTLVSYGETSKYGSEIPLAALGITVKVSQLISGITLGLATGCQPILGFNYGSGQYDRVKKVYKLDVTISTMIMVVAFLIFQFAPQYIILLFGQESELYMEFAVKCFRIFLLLCPAIGMNVSTSTLFQSIGKPLYAAIISLSRQIIFLLPSIIILSRIMGVEGALWAGPVGDGMAFVLSVALVMINWKKIFAKA